MASLSYKQLKRNYPELRLLPYSNEALDLGEIIEWRGPITRRNIWFSGQNIIGRFNTAGEKDLIKRVQSVKKVPAAFATIKLDKNGITDMAASIPNAGIDFEGKLATEKLVSFSFENCSVRRLEDGLLENILDEFDGLSAAKKRQLKRIEFLAKLFYSESVEIETKTAISANVEAELKANKVTFERTSSKNSIFTIKAKNSPFAIGLSSFKDYVL